LTIKDIARQIFILFKKRTDGANSDVDEIAPGNVRNFFFENKIPIGDVAEAFQLLQLRNLIMPSTNTNSYYQLTTLGKSVDPDDIFEKIVDRAFVSQLSEFIDQELVRGCLDKSYEDAITSAFRILEERIRKRISAGPELFGMDLVEAAFHHEKGKLVFGDTDSERQAAYQIFRSAFLMLRNPPSHRYLKDFAGAEIVEIVLFVDFLLKVISKSSKRSQ
jgi:hypothetical protein